MGGIEMKKRTIAAVLALALCLATLVVPALAHGCHRARRSAAPRVTMCASPCVDANKDGICDNYGVHHAFVDANGDGLCDNWRAHHTCVDANGDGVCDRAAWHVCAGYVDADGNGVCDHCGGACPGSAVGNGTAAVQTGRGCGHGCCHH